MKSILRIISVFLLILSLYAEGNAQSTLTIPTIAGASPGAVAVNVSATGLTNMVSFQFTINYDNTKLSYNTVSNWYTGITTANVYNNAAAGYITFSYYNVTPVTLTSGTFFTINFTFTSGTANITWSNTPTPIEIGNSSGLVIQTTNTNGSVSSIGGNPVITQQPSSQVKCVGEAVSFSVVATGATTYQWRKNGVNVTSGSGGTTSTYSISAVTTGDAANSPGYTCVVGNGSSSVTSNAATLTVNSAPVQPGTITGSTILCQPATQTYSVAAVSGATSYVWTLPSGWSGSSSTNSISVTVSSSGTLAVAASNSCGPGLQRTLAVAVGLTVYNVSGGGSYCEGGAGVCISLSGSQLGIEYKLLLNNIYTGTTLQGTGNALSFCNILTAGNYSLMAFNASTSCSINMTGSATVSVNPLPAQPGTITGNSPVCQGSSHIYTINGVAGATSYTWTMPTGWTGTSITTSLTAIVGSGSGNISVVANNACGSSLPGTFAVTSTTAPAQPGTITGELSVCPTSPKVYSITAVPGAASYTWTLPSGWTGSSTTNSISVTSGTSGGTISVIATNFCGNSTARTASITLKTLSSAPTTISAPANILTGQTTVLNVSGGTLGTGASYKWYTTSCGGAAAGTGSSISVTPNTTTTYYARIEGDCNTTSCLSTTVFVSLSSTILVRAANVSTCSSTAHVPITASNMQNIASLSLRLTYNPSIITYSGYQNVNPSLSSQIAIFGSNGVILTSWFSLIPVSLVNDTLYVLNFSGTSGSSNLIWDTLTTGACEFNDQNGSVLSSHYVNGSVTFSIPATPLITGPTTICQSSSTTYTIQPIPGATSYTWYVPQGWTGSSNSTSISVTPNANSAAISVAAFNACGPGTSGYLYVAVNLLSTAPTAATANPASIQLGMSTTLSYSGGTLGTAATAKWYSGSCGGTLVGTGNNLSVIPGSLPITYYVRFEGSCGNTTCTTVTVTATTISPPVITQHPSSAVKCPGNSVSFVVVATGVGTLSYQWQKDGVNVTSGTGGNTSTYTLSNLTSADAASSPGYVCKVTNTGGSITSNAATLTINPLPSTPGTITGTTAAAQGQSYTYSIGSVLNATSYSWNYTGTGTTISGSGTSITLTFSATATSGSLFVKGVNSCGDGPASNPLAITVGSSLPVIVTQPNSLAKCVGQSAIFYVNATGSGTLSYQWQKNGVNVTNGTGGTTNTFYIASVALTDAANSPGYTCKVTNSGGTVTTNAATLTVNTAPTANAGVDQSIVLGSSATLTGSATGGTTPYTYLWSTGSSTQSISVSPIVTTTYTLTVTGTNTCSSTDQVVVNVNVTSAIITTAPTLTVCQSNVIVPISVQNFNSVASISLALGYNTSILTYTGYQNLNPNLLGGFAVVNTSGGKVVFAWFSLSPVSIVNSATLVEYKFTAIAGSSTLIWDTLTQGSCQYSDLNGDPMLSHYINGSITYNPLSVSWPGTLANQCATSLTYTLSGGTPSGGTYSGPGVTGTNFNPSVAGAGTHTLTYTYTNPNGCSNSTSKTITVVGNASIAPTLASASPASIILGNGTTLSYSGGSLSSGDIANWYTGACGTTILGSGNNYFVTPATLPTTYYVRFEGSCGNTSCASVTVTQATTCTPPWTPMQNMQNNMNIIGQVSLSGTISTNPNDAIGAFVGTECRGIAYPNQALNGVVFLTVQSNVASGETLTFRAWNSTTCSECTVSETEPFVSQSSLGSMQTPYLFHGCGITQTNIFPAGYTWFSVNVDRGSWNINTLMGTLSSSGGLRHSPSQNDRIIGQTSFATYYGTSWVGSLTTLDPKKMYIANFASADTLIITGNPVSSTSISLPAGYTWLGYLPQCSKTVNTALSGISPAPAQNDRIIGQTSFATYYGTSWVGSLTNMLPSKAYKMSITNTGTLLYPSCAKAGIEGCSDFAAENSDWITHDNMQFTMNIICKVIDENGAAVSGKEYQLGSFVENDCRGICVQPDCVQDLFFISIASDRSSGETIHFDLRIDDQNFDIVEKIPYVESFSLGTIENPIVLTLAKNSNPSTLNPGFYLSNAQPNPFTYKTQIEYRIPESSIVKIKLFDCVGNEIALIVNENKAQGSYKVVLSGNDLSSGIYYYQIDAISTNNHFTETRKLVLSK